MLRLYSKRCCFVKFRGGRTNPPRPTHRIIDPGIAGRRGGVVPTNQALPLLLGYAYGV